jgi:hypothetical protein
MSRDIFVGMVFEASVKLHGHDFVAMPPASGILHAILLMVSGRLVQLGRDQRLQFPPPSLTPSRLSRSGTPITAT